MPDPIDLMVMLFEANELAGTNPAVAQHIDQLNVEINAASSRNGFVDAENVKADMALPIARIVQARKIAL